MTVQARFSSALEDVTTNRTIYVDTIRALPTPVGNVITLEDGVVYILTAAINLGVNQLAIPTNGQVAIKNNNELTNSITTDLVSGGLITGNLARLVIQDVNFISSTGAGSFFDITAVTAARPVVIHQRSFVSNFASIGTIDGATSIANNVVFSGCGAGITLADNGTALGAGCVWDTVNFISQTGDHITITGNSDFLSFNTIVAAPSTGDQVFEVSAAATASSSFGQQLFDGSNGGTLGLDITYTSDATISNLYEDVGVDTSGGAVTLTLPLAADNLRREINIKKKPGGAPLTIATSGSDTIDSNSSITIRGSRAPSVRLRANDEWGVR